MSATSLPVPSHVRTAVAAAVTALVLAACWTAAAANPPPTRDAAAIPPGKEDLLAAMLGRGAALPDACAFVGGQIERSVVRGTYRCGADESILELREASDAPPETLRTEKIAIVPVRGTPPPGLVAAIANLVRAREADFDWLRPNRLPSTTREPGCRSLAPLPNALDPYVPGCRPLATTVLVGIAQTVVITLGLGCGLVRIFRGSPSADAG